MEAIGKCLFDPGNRRGRPYHAQSGHVSYPPMGCSGRQSRVGRAPHRSSSATGGGHPRRRRRCHYHRDGCRRSGVRGRGRQEADGCVPIFVGSVIAEWLRTTTGASAPRKSAVGSRSARPIATAYRNTSSHSERTRCAVSCFPRLRSAAALRATAVLQWTRWAACQCAGRRTLRNARASFPTSARSGSWPSAPSIPARWPRKCRRWRRAQLFA